MSATRCDSSVRARRGSDVGLIFGLVGVELLPAGEFFLDHLTQLVVIVRADIPGLGKPFGNTVETLASVPADQEAHWAVGCAHAGLFTSDVRRFIQAQAAEIGRAHV